MEKPFHILIISVGSLLGQNLLDTLENRRSSIRVTGMNTVGDNQRVFRCDKAYKSPLSNSPDFLEFLQEIIEKERPDMILPGRDYDVMALAKLVRSMPALQKLVPGGTIEAANIMNDKGESYRFAQAYNLPFAASFILGEGKAEEARVWAQRYGFPLLAKPREGFGSLGIRTICGESQLEALLHSDSEGFMLQEVLGASEEWHKSIASFSREVAAGIPLFFHTPDANQFAGQTIIRPDGSVGEIFTSRSVMVLGRCEKTMHWNDPDFIAVTRAYAEAIADAGWRGVFNLQCRQTSHGYIGVEMNGRMSGSTSARGWLGYDEMRTLIRDFYHIDIGSDARYPQNTPGTVYRYLTDYFVADKDAEVFNQTGVWMPDRTSLNIANQSIEKKRILVTGSTGYLGQPLIYKLSQDGNYEISVITGNKSIAQQLFGDKVTKYYEQKEWLSGALPSENIDVLIHLGFARPHYGNTEIAKSLQFTAELFSRAAKRQIKGIINVSSRSVYGIENVLPWREEDVPAPVSPYAQAKLASELLLQTVADSHSHIRGASIRMGAVSGGSAGLVDVFVLSKFVMQALKGESIQIDGGKQKIDVLDIHDAVDALIAMLNTPVSVWKATYNLGSESAYNIVTMAETCVDIASRHNGGVKSDIIIKEKPVHLQYEMDSSLFSRDMNWRHKEKLKDTIESLVLYYQNP